MCLRSQDRTGKEREAGGRRADTSLPLSPHSSSQSVTFSRSVKSATARAGKRVSDGMDDSQSQRKEETKRALSVCRPSLRFPIHTHPSAYLGVDPSSPLKEGRLLNRSCVIRYVFLAGEESRFPNLIPRGEGRERSDFPFSREQLHSSNFSLTFPRH